MGCVETLHPVLEPIPRGVTTHVTPPLVLLEIIAVIT